MGAAPVESREGESLRPPVLHRTLSEYSLSETLTQQSESHSLGPRLSHLRLGTAWRS